MEGEQREIGKKILPSPPTLPGSSFVYKEGAVRKTNTHTHTHTKQNKKEMVLPVKWKLEIEKFWKMSCAVNVKYKALRMVIILNTIYNAKQRQFKSLQYILYLILIHDVLVFTHKNDADFSHSYGMQMHFEELFSVFFFLNHVMGHLGASVG